MKRAQSTEDREWLTSFFADVLSDPSLRRRVNHHALQLQEPDTPDVTPSDIQAAVPYLRVCVLNMTPNEAAAMTIDDLAALWARGAAGAAKYRTKPARWAAPDGRPMHSRHRSTDSTDVQKDKRLPLGRRR
jgi:hypothetical protein